jgi:acetyl-CoA carboxylase biotin carboxyl carrier protein
LAVTRTEPGRVGPVRGDTPRLCDVIKRTVAIYRLLSRVPTLAKRKPVKPVTEKTTASSPMDFTLLAQVVKLMKSNDLTYVEVRDGDKRVILRSGQVPETSGFPMAFAAPSGPSSAPAPTAAAPAPPANPDEGLIPIKSPMVGTFYASSGPDAKAFVAVGSAVDEETDVCIIEAMKVFNNIKAETKGTIAKIAVTNGQTVEFGQTLFLVKP